MMDEPKEKKQPKEQSEDKKEKESKKKISFKENWLKVDEVCVCCNQIIKKQRGITRQNLKRLIRPKFTLDEIIITFMLIMVIALAFVYQSETKQCRDWITPMFKGDLDNCKAVCNMRCEMTNAIRERNALNYTRLENITNELNEFNGTQLTPP